MTGNGTSEEDESSYSSFYSSFLKTSSSSNDGRAENSIGSVWEKEIKFPLKRPIPQWLDTFESTSEDLVYQYQLSGKSLQGIFEGDSKEVSQVSFTCVINIEKGHLLYKNNTYLYHSQPDLVNDQLNQLYLDFEIEGFSTKFSLESTSGSSGEDEASLKIRRKKIKYSKLVLIYEENCPIPSTNSE